MIKSLTNAVRNAVRNAVAKYKAQRVKAVIAEYASYTHVHAATVIPLALHFYEDAASFVVDRTFEDPQPLVNLLDAVQGAVDHYGPGLSVMLKGFSARLEEAGDEVLISKIDRLISSIEEMKEDVNDH